MVSCMGIKLYSLSVMTMIKSIEKYGKMKNESMVTVNLPMNFYENMMMKNM